MKTGDGLLAALTWMSTTRGVPSEGQHPKRFDPHFQTACACPLLFESRQNDRNMDLGRFVLGSLILYLKAMKMIIEPWSSQHYMRRRLV